MSPANVRPCLQAHAWSPLPNTHSRQRILSAPCPCLSERTYPHPPPIHEAHARLRRVRRAEANRHHTLHEQITKSRRSRAGVSGSEKVLHNTKACCHSQHAYSAPCAHDPLQPVCGGHARSLTDLRVVLEDADLVDVAQLGALGPHVLLQLLCGDVKGVGDGVQSIRETATKSPSSDQTLATRPHKASLLSSGDSAPSTSSSPPAPLPPAPVSRMLSRHPAPPPPSPPTSSPAAPSPSPSPPTSSPAARVSSMVPVTRRPPLACN